MIPKLLSPDEQEILHHTLHLAAGGRYHGGGAVLDQLCARGLMRDLGQPSWAPDHYYAITPAGKLALAAADGVNLARIQVICRILCERDGHDPQTLTPGNIPYTDDDGYEVVIVDGQLHSAPAHYIWRKYVPTAHEILHSIHP